MVNLRPISDHNDQNIMCRTNETFIFEICVNFHWNRLFWISHQEFLLKIYVIIMHTTLIGGPEVLNNGPCADYSREIRDPWREIHDPGHKIHEQGHNIHDLRCLGCEIHDPEREICQQDANLVAKYCRYPHYRATIPNHVLYTISWKTAKRSL